MRNCYKVILLRGDDGKLKFFQTHRFVAAAFIPNLKNKPLVDHINGNKLDNCATNLRWATYSENARNTPKHRQKGKITQSKKWCRENLSAGDYELAAMGDLSKVGMEKEEKEVVIYARGLSHTVITRYLKNKTGRQNFSPDEIQADRKRLVKRKSERFSCPLCGAVLHLNGLNSQGEQKMICSKKCARFNVKEDGKIVKSRSNSFGNEVVSIDKNGKRVKWKNMRSFGRFAKRNGVGPNIGRAIKHGNKAYGFLWEKAP